MKCHVARGGYTGEDGFEVREANTNDVAGIFSRSVYLCLCHRSPSRLLKLSRSPNSSPVSRR